MQKTNFKTRLLALLTAVFMVIVSMPFAAFAAGEGGTDVIPNEINVYFNAYDGIVGLKLKADDAVDSSAGVARYVLNSVSGYKELPTVINVPEDKEFDGWYIAGTNVEVVATRFDFDSLKDYAVKDNHQKDNVTIEARFKDKAVEPEKEVTVNINLSDPEAGYFTNNKAAKTLTYEHLDADGKIEDLEHMVTANEGYEFTGWTWSGNGEGTLDVGAKEFMYTDSAFYNGDDTTGYVTLTAQFKKVETQKKYFHVYFTVDPEKGSFTDYGKGPVTFEGYEDEVGDQQYDVPAVTAKEGYKFVGWKGQGASEIAWDDVKTFGVTGLCFYENGKYDGYASIEAVFEPTVKLTDIKVNFLKEDGKTVVCAAQYFAKDATLVLPYDVEGVTGWKLANNLTTYDAKTKFTFADLAAFVGTNYAADGTAELTFYAQYKQDVKTDSTSTSSSSNTTTTAASQQQVVEASSNTTTTAASQKQVVKAAAAPANTTKVLPKTGATNAAPLIGGSLAVVALLMGYGVYGLVLRKKD